MTTKTRKLTIKALRTRSPWEIASELGLRYSGDMNPIPHGGYFYNTHNWETYGYSEIVRFQESEGVLYLETGTINRPSNKSDAEILVVRFQESEGVLYLETGTVVWDYDKTVISDPVTPEILIECVESCWGAEIDNSQEFRSDNGKGWGDFPEFRIMQAARGLILGLCA